MSQPRKESSVRCQRNPQWCWCTLVLLKQFQYDLKAVYCALPETQTLSLLTYCSIILLVSLIKTFRLFTPLGRKVLEKRKKAEEEEEKWKERQKQREKKLQKVISKRAQANDPHVALAQTCKSKIKEFR